MNAVNPWLTAMGLPQWQLRGQAVATRTVMPAEEEAAVPTAVVAEPAKIVASAGEEHTATEQVAETKSASVEPVIAAPVVTAEIKPVPLLVIWDEQQEQAVAGAGSLPSGELGDLLANIVVAVGLTEDVVEAWSTPPENINALLLAKGLGPRSIWYFSAGTRANHQSLKVDGLPQAVELISAPSLRELQAQKPLKAQLWRLLKPLADAGLWR